MPASSVPEIECQVQETAQMIADSGVAENCAVADGALAGLNH